MNNDCLFCKLVNKEIESKIIYEDDLVVACLDAFPDACGHTLIIPKKHYEDFTVLDNDIILHINEIAKKLVPMLMDKMGKDGILIGANYGSRQVIKHYHLHLLPGYKKNETGNITKPEEAYKIIVG